MSRQIIYTSDDGNTRISLRIEADSIWLSQLEIAELFQTTKQNVSLHAKNIFAEGELSPEATVKESLTVQTEGKNYYSKNILIRFNSRPGTKACHSRGSNRESSLLSL